MPIPDKYRVDFDEERIYHVYNRTNNSEKLFLSDENRRFFLSKYNEYISSFADTYCWSLLPNHFHFLIRIRSRKKIIKSLIKKELSDRTFTEKEYMEGRVTTSELIERLFKRFFQSYSLSFNKANNRKGNLFYKCFKRVLIEKESHFTQVIVYIHANPVKHHIVSDFTKYEWSSWRDLLFNQRTELLRDEMMDWFGGSALFIKVHIELTKFYYESGVSIED